MKYFIIGYVVAELSIGILSIIVGTYYLYTGKY